MLTRSIKIKLGDDVYKGIFVKFLEKEILLIASAENNPKLMKLDKKYYRQLRRTKLKKEYRELCEYQLNLYESRKYLEKIVQKSELVYTGKMKKSSNKEALSKMVIIQERLFKKVHLPKKDIVSYLLDYKRKRKIDYICLEKEGSMKFKHITTIESAEKIMRGLSRLKNSDYIMDLGEGLYGYLNTLEGQINIEDYIRESYSDEDTLVVMDCEYQGKYIQCIIGLGHEDYVVIKDVSRIKGIDYEELSVEDFLY